MARGKVPPRSSGEALDGSPSRERDEEGRSEALATGMPSVSRVPDAVVETLH